MNVTFFGTKLLEHFKPMPPSVLARATGIWLGTFEDHLVAPHPSDFYLQSLADLSVHAWRLWSVDAVSFETLSEWRAVKDGTTPTTITWDEIPVTESSNGPDPQITNWLKAHPVFTLSAFMGIIDEKRTEKASDILRPLGFRNRVEKSGSVWRWNPLDVAPMGRPAIRRWVPAVAEAALDYDRIMRGRFADVYRTVTTKLISNGVHSVTLEQVVAMVFGYPIKNQTRLQKIRNGLKDVGWVYNASDKVWKWPG